MDIDAEYFVFDDLSAGGLKITAKRYTTRSRVNNKGLTLLFAHCIGSRKYSF
jgi:hypothetical protein